MRHSAEQKSATPGRQPTRFLLGRGLRPTSGRRGVTGGNGVGASGLIAIQQKDGIAIVQDPDDAADPSMPRPALNIGHPNYSVRLTEIAPFWCV
jgi:hypothetical protein